MIRREVSPRKLTGGQAMLLILCAVMSLFLLSFLARLIQRLTGLSFAPFVLWLAAGIGVLTFMNRFLRGYIYTINEGTLYIERTMGTHSRLILQIPVSKISSVTPCPPSGEAPNDRLLVSRCQDPVWRVTCAGDPAPMTLDIQAPADLISALTAAQDPPKDS